MILQALARYYDDLLRQGKIADQGWGSVKISFALCLSNDGNLEQVISLMHEEHNGKKTVMRPQTMTLPAAVKKTSGASSNFLWENSAYMLGIDQKGKPERSKLCFKTASELHHKILKGVDSPTAEAIQNFFDSWNIDEAAEHCEIKDQFAEITSGANMVFRVNGVFPQDDPKIREAWNSYNSSKDENAVYMQCLITGQNDEIPAIHPSIKGVRDAQSSGAALVSFNAPAFCSYGHEQNYNAPVGKKAAFAYTSALNYLIADKDNVQHIGDTTVVCWAEGADNIYQTFSMAALFGNEMPGLTENDLRRCVAKLADGFPCEDIGIDPERKFYILGLAPNAARLSVRFFLCNSFGTFMTNINEHYKRLEIVRPSFAKKDLLPMWELLRETVNPKSKDKSASPVLSGALARAVFSGGLYPASLIEAVMLRIRAERDISWEKAAIIKAYYLKNISADIDKEVLTVGLNEECTDTAYVLGRLFAIYEQTQREVSPNINSTIKDKYFNSAASIPASIFPILNNLYQKHLRKIGNAGRRIYLDKQVGNLKDKLGEVYPARMTLSQQGAFDLGYYHQTQKYFEKKEEK